LSYASISTFVVHIITRIARLSTFNRRAVAHLLFHSVRVDASRSNWAVYIQCGEKRILTFNDGVIEQK